MNLRFRGSPQSPLASDGSVLVDVPSGGGIVSFDSNGNPVITPLGASTGANIVSTATPSGSGNVVGQFWIQSTTNFLWYWDGAAWIGLIGS